MKVRSLQTRFILAGCFLVLTTAAPGLWSVFTFARLSAVVNESLGESQKTIDLTANLASALEREDDALLLFVQGDQRRARSQLNSERRRFETTYARLRSSLVEPAEMEAADALRRHVNRYRQAGNDLLAAAGEPGVFRTYQTQVNPALQRAVADCARIRELSFRSMERAGIQARDAAASAIGIVAGISLVALVLSTLVAVRLARAILTPVRELTLSVDAIRRDDFNCRVSVDSQDELGQLAEGFNRMAETLADYRNSSLGELLLAKMTLEATLAVLPDAVIVVDPDGNIVTTNPFAQKILAATGNGESKRLRDLVLPAPIHRAVEETLSGQPSGNGPMDLSQAVAVSLNGQSFKLLLTVAPIPEFLPRRCGAAIVLADVTDIARLDELRSELVAVASHELRTPLTAVQMNLLLLQEKADNLTPRQQEILAAALQGNEELAGTIDELLDLTRIEAGQLRLQRDQVDLYALTNQVVQALRLHFEDAEVALRLVWEAPEAIVQGDAARLRLVLGNLLTNALKYTPRGGKVTIRVTPDKDDRSSGKSGLQMVVTDTGPGIPPEFRERVFEKFFRVEHQRETGQEGVRGAGIGLYLCRQIIEAHGGIIHCQAGDSGRGTRMVIHLVAEDSRPV